MEPLMPHGPESDIPKAPSHPRRILVAIAILLVLGLVLYIIIGHKDKRTYGIPSDSSTDIKKAVVQPVQLKSESATDWKTLIPEDMKIMGEADGDVNSDGFKDVVLLLRNKNDGVDDKYYDGLLMVITGSKEGVFTVAVKNTTAMTPLACADLNEPLNTSGKPLIVSSTGDIIFKEFNFSGEQGYEDTLTFRFDKGVWPLIKHTYAGYGVGQSKPFKTGSYSQSELKNQTIENYHADLYDVEFCAALRKGN